MEKSRITLAISFTLGLLVATILIISGLSTKADDIAEELSEVQAEYEAYKAEAEETIAELNADVADKLETIRLYNMNLVDLESSYITLNAKYEELLAQVDELPIVPSSLEAPKTYAEKEALVEENADVVEDVLSAPEVEESESPIVWVDPHEDIPLVPFDLSQPNHPSLRSVTYTKSYIPQ